MRPPLKSSILGYWPGILDRVQAPSGQYSAFTQPCTFFYCIQTVVSMSTSEDDQRIRDLERFEELSVHANDLRTRIAVLLDELHVFEDASSVDDTTDIEEGQIVVPEWSIPIKANVLDFNWKSLASYTQFDVILMDPPWRLTSNTPTRGVRRRPDDVAVLTSHR